MNDNSDLPGLLADIADVAGLDAAMTLAEAVGGTRVTIPARVPHDHWLVRTVGRKAAEAICNHFRTLSAEGREAGARHIVIPKGPAGCLDKARRRLAKELHNGASAREAARRAGLSERAAFRMRARMREDENGPQGRLF
ncbi:hypothetical protein [Stappia indica]|uniref:Homeodomain-like domain-containing protein n=1 Tax=Stappia indica TaxID=538381 RepID=A0A285TSM4_9HYPH|nr:hypothetical protein [Stappia indica]SOC26925.1 hypothetical protein SAMN05421512_11723 [Stappia indica]